MIDKLLDEFGYTSAEAWLAQIAKDLKGKTLEEMYWSPDGDVRVNPFVHAEDVPETMPPLASFGTWMIGESFEVSDAGKSNLQIHEALKGGAESLHLVCNDQVQWDQLLTGVELPMIHLGLQCSGKAETSLHDFFGYTTQRFPGQTLHVTLHGVSNTGYASPRYCAPPVSMKTRIDGLEQTIIGTLDSAERKPDMLTLYDLSVHIEMHYLVEIARLRALRILWIKLAAELGFTLSPSFGIEAYTAPYKAGDDVYQHMIRSTVMGLAAILGGADRVYISPGSGGQHEMAFHRRIARNIHHLLRYESKLTELPDPVAGAYYIEALTQEMVEKVWERVTSKI